MRPLCVYLDTSVIGGVFDAEFAEDSHRLFQAVRNGRAMALISETTTGELAPAPPRKFGSCCWTCRRRGSLS